MRECGILLPVTSLPSKYGIGTFSKEAYQFVDDLKRAGQSYWQVLPLGPTGYGDSPYQPFSAFAGNPYLIDLETLIEEGYLKRDECDHVDMGSDESRIHYGKLYKNRFRLLRMAYYRWCAKGYEVEYEARDLLEETKEYCFYMALKDYFEGKSWSEWDFDIRMKQEEAMEKYHLLLKEEIGFYEFQQLMFQKQWSHLKSYANERGIKIIGDLPIYVSFDSADSWYHKELFQFDSSGVPIKVAGCPPDAFAPTGQLWGNPIYQWEEHKRQKYSWWIKRMKYSFTLYDKVRLDHFRGFDQYYSIPYKDQSAEYGGWEKGPGMDFFHALEEHLGACDIIAEDLGFLTSSVRELVKETGYMGMKVLEFAFDSDGTNEYFPHNYESWCVVYTGTHDNSTLVGWYESLGEGQRTYVNQYLGMTMSDGELACERLIWLAFSSVADLVVIPMQDYLKLGNEARLNQPSKGENNWTWRMKQGAFTKDQLTQCLKLATLSARVKHDFT